MSRLKRFSRKLVASKNIGFAESQRHGIMLLVSATLGAAWAAGMVIQPWATENGTLGLIGLACVCFSGMGLASYLFMVHVSGWRRLKCIGKAYGEIKREEALAYYSTRQETPFCTG